MRNPSGARRAAISAWQPASSGVSERRAISSRVERERGLGARVHARDVSRATAMQLERDAIARARGCIVDAERCRF